MAGLKKKQAGGFSFLLLTLQNHQSIAAEFVTHSIIIICTGIDRFSEKTVCRGVNLLKIWRLFLWKSKKRKYFCSPDYYP